MLIRDIEPFADSFNALTVIALVLSIFGFCCILFELKMFREIDGLYQTHQGSMMKIKETNKIKGIDEIIKKNFNHVGKINTEITGNFLSV